MNLFRFNGVNKKDNYFEGWYIHLLDADKTIAYAIIFGITLYKKDPHAFIQIIDKKNEEPYYFRFDISEFYYNNDAIRIKDNILSPLQVIIKQRPFNINLNISGLSLVKNNIFMPGVMGPFKWLPLPINIEVIFLDAIVSGTINGKDFSGSAYMEKNWGKCFPTKWIWIESNNFGNTSTSFVLAYSTLPLNIVGFFSILNINNKQYRFSTYNGYKAKIIKSNKDKIIIEIYKGKITLKVELNYKEEHKLIAPIKNGEMTRDIKESLNCDLKLSLHQEQKLIYSDSAINAACENTYYEK